MWAAFRPPHQNPLLCGLIVVGPTHHGASAPYPRPVLGRRIRGYPRHRHLHRPRLHLVRRPLHPCRPPPLGRPDGLRLLRLCLGLRPLRNPRRIPGRLDRRPPRAPAHRAVVVVLHRRHRMGLELRLPRHHPHTIRSRRSRLFPQSHENLHHLAPAPRARPRPRHHVAQRPLGRRLHPPPWYTSPSRSCHGVMPSNSSAASV